jgi:hypothetical protein
MAFRACGFTVSRRFADRPSRAYSGSSCSNAKANVVIVEDASGVLKGGNGFCWTGGMEDCGYRQRL